MRDSTCGAPAPLALTPSRRCWIVLLKISVRQWWLWNSLSLWMQMGYRTSSANKLRPLLHEWYVVAVLMGFACATFHVTMDF